MKSEPYWGKIKTFFSIDLRKNISNVDELMKLPVKYEIPDGMLDRLLQAFPHDVVKL